MEEETRPEVHKMNPEEEERSPRTGTICTVKRTTLPWGRTAVL